jgi:hypothetical protein
MSVFGPDYSDDMDNHFRWNLNFIFGDRIIVTGMIRIIANRGDLQLKYDADDNHNYEICRSKKEGKCEVVPVFN